MGNKNSDSNKSNDKENYPPNNNCDDSEDSLTYFDIYNQLAYFSFVPNYSLEQYLENNNNNQTITHNYTKENSIGSQPQNKNSNNVNMEIEKEDNNTIYEQDINKKVNNMNNNQEELFDINQNGMDANKLENELEAFEEEQKQNDTKIGLINEKNENSNEKDNDAYEIVFCEDKQIPKEKDMMKKPPAKRYLDFNISKNVIFNRCSSNTVISIKQLLIPFGVSENLIIITTKNKIGYSYGSNRNFFLIEIGDLISNSYPNNIKKSNKEAKKEKIEKILKNEMNDKTKEIKAINATFHLIFLDFLYAFLEDESIIIIKNDYDDNNKTKVYFYKSDQSPLHPYIKIKFETYKDCFNEKYPQELKQFYKEQIILLIKGQLRRVRNHKNK